MIDGGWDYGGPVVSNPDENSQAAARPIASTSRRGIWRLIRSNPAGVACWEVEQMTNGLHQSVSSTINWLWSHGMLIRDGKNRTPSGRPAHIYRAVTKAEAEAPATPQPEPKPPAARPLDLPLFEWECPRCLKDGLHREIAVTVTLDPKIGIGTCRECRTRQQVRRSPTAFLAGR